MDRRKAEAKNHLKNLEDECKLTVELLNKLLTTCSSHVDVLEGLNPKDFMIHSKYFLAITQFQYHSLQKLLEINLNLEQFITEEQSPNLQSTGVSCTIPINIEKPSSSSTSEQLVTTPTHLPIEKPLSPSTSEQLQLEIESQNNSMQQAKLDMVTNYIKDLNKDRDSKQTILNDAASAASSEYFYCNSNANDSKANELMFDENSFEKEETCDGNIIDTLKSLPKKSTENVLDMPNVTLQPSDKKMSIVFKEKTVHFDNFSDIEYDSYDDDDVIEAVPETCIEICERPSVQVNDLCMLGCIESPSSFYVQVADENITILDVLSTQIESVTSNKCSFMSKDHAMKVLGKYCTINIDSRWYRVEILDWLMDYSDIRNDKVIIQLIDYGNKYSHTYKDLHPLLSEFYHIPKIAQLCHLDGLYPPCSKKNAIVENWPEECIEGFMNACGDLETAIFRITHVSSTQEKNSYAIELMHTEEEKEDVGIGQILLNANLAVTLDDDLVFGNNTMINQIQACHGLQGINSQTSRDDVLENFFSRYTIEEASNINEAVMHYNPLDEALTCRNLRPDGTCYKGSSCRLRHVPLKDGFTRDKHPVYNSALVETVLPMVNEEVLVTVSHIVDIQCFYAQIRNSENADSLMPTISNLIKTMNAQETIKLYKPLRYPPAISEIVIVKHWNTYWYRGQVRLLQIPENNNNNKIMVEVFVVDFGDILTVPITDLRVIMPEFLSLPFQAVECRLYNIRHKRGLDEVEERRYFESRYLGQKFRAKIIAVPGHLQVLLYTMDGEDVGEILIECGYGEPNSEHNFSRDNEIYLID